ncbi:hypothetical protein L211DRAFT_230643 [Terfezia boudieri ATCC MYA-4762]|uniref:DUF8004 domain-containing protein n=1 Tax=Terfezia boudieri ATCC MYA-4762 TaxID=1051890 RepID=A0A3N4LBR1_9PEZI|nr:hypothetical protein L211DRAFT_230643 [Terfezia boudieri ATCC MYA-4762]
MAQRSARARSKLDKISQSSSGPSQFTQGHSTASAPPSVAGSSSPAPFGAYHNVSRSTSFNPATGLLTPSASSIATGSSGYSSAQHSHPGGGSGGGRHGFPFYNKNGAAVRKSAIRAIFEGKSDKIRGRIEDVLRNKKSASESTTNSGYTLGGGLKKLGDIREDKLLPVKRWDAGGKTGAAGWDNLQKDPELWQSDGDTLVYLSPHGHPSHHYSRPSFRIKSSVLRATESPYFTAILTENKSLSFAPLRPQPPPNHRPPTPPSMPGSLMSVTSESFEQLDRISSFTESNNGPCISKTISNTPSSGAEGIKYEIHFPAPIGLSKEQTHKYHLTTRNVFAVLFGKALVGVTLGATLLDLVERMDVYIPPTTQPKLQHHASSVTLKGARKRKNRSLDLEGKSENVARVLEYLLNREFDDLRNCPDVAAGILVFAEKFQLGDLWREAFCHCVGMLNRMEGGKEYMEISPITKALIDRALLEIQVRTGAADSRLATFQYDDIWPTSSFTFSPSRIAFERFQKFLIKHYQSRFGAWPPPPPQKDSNSGGGWGFGLGGGNGATGVFSRQIYLQLQRDFAALYDYVVDKDVSWDYPPPGNSSPTSMVDAGISVTTLGGGVNLRNKPKMVSPNRKHFRADDDNLPLTEILIRFDRANGFPHIPHPYPLVPELRGMLRQGTSGAIGMQNMAHQQLKHGFLAKRGTTNTNTISSSAAAAMDKAAALALSESTNIHSLLSRTASNELVDAFTKHEKERSNGEFTPAEGRKGRWILIYSVLQTLATVAGDAPGLKYTDGVEYFLNSKLRGTPPWVSGGILAEEVPGGIDDHHTRSHCWTVMGTWDARRNSWVVKDNDPQLQLTPVVSSNSGSSAPLRTSGDMYSENLTTSRSIGVGVGDTTDTESGYQNSRIHGGRKRKAIPKVDTVDVHVKSGRSASMSGDEGDDEADEEDDDVVMRDARDIPLLEREVDLQMEDSN